MSTLNGSLVTLYLYKAVWTLTYAGTGGFKLRIGDTETATITDTADLGDSLESALDTVLGAGNYSVSGTYDITLLEDYAFSGINFEIAEADSGVTVSIARKFPTAITTASEANGFYIMGAETSLDKTMTIESQDVTSKSSGGWKESASQIRSIAHSSANYFMSTENYKALKKQFELLNPVIICDIDPDIATTKHIQNYGVYVINSLAQSAVHNQVVDFTADFELTGSLEIVDTE